MGVFQQSPALGGVLPMSLAPIVPPGSGPVTLNTLQGCPKEMLLGVSAQTAFAAKYVKAFALWFSV